MTTPKYRTDARACSCPGFWYRQTCKHIRAYRDAQALVLAQDAVNVTGTPEGAGTSLYGPLSAMPKLDAASTIG